MLQNAQGSANNKPTINWVIGSLLSIVFAVDIALETAYNAIFFNMGQVCVAGSRLYIHEDIYDEFIKKATEKAKKRRVGDPFDPTMESGPQVSQWGQSWQSFQSVWIWISNSVGGFQVNAAQFKKILDLIESGKQEGATLLCGGSRLGSKGYFIEPTLFADVKDNMRIFKEEVLSVHMH